MKTSAERGPIGAWAQEARDDAGLSVDQVIEQLRAKGSAVTPSTLRGVEGGSKKPGRRLLRELGAIYGSMPPGEEPEPTPDLVNAMREQTAAINALVEELRFARALQLETNEAVLRGLGSLGADLTPAGKLSGAGLGPPVDTRR